MASLALIVGLIFLTVILSGPMVFLLSKYKILPRFIIQILSVGVIFLGLWWMFIVVTPIRFLGLFTAYLGCISFRGKHSVQRNSSTDN